MNLAEYKFDHPYCELLRHFPRVGREIVVPLQPAVHFPLFGNQCEVEGAEIHHVIGGDPVGRTDDPRNVLHVCRDVHAWLTQHSCAGRVLSCYELAQQDRIDWAFLTQISRKCYPSILATDKYIENCRPWPFVEAMRQQLLKRKAA